MTPFLYIPYLVVPYIVGMAVGVFWRERGETGEQDMRHESHAAARTQRGRS